MSDALYVCVSVSDVSHLFVGSRLRDTRDTKRRQVFFFLNFGDVGITVEESHKSMKWIIMHEPLTQ